MIFWSYFINCVLKPKNFLEKNSWNFSRLRI